jgi:H+/Cl- antiporter ClcA
LRKLKVKNYKYREYFAHVMPCLWYGILCGSVTGAFIFFFKLAAHELSHLSKTIYDLARQSPLLVCITLAALVGMAFLMYFIHRLMPESRGGGIPRSEGILRGVLSYNKFKALIGTTIGSCMSFLCGLPLGSEGPAVLIGTSLGAVCSNVSGKRSAWSRYIMTSGAGAGFAVATGSPVSAILFALEEIHKRFTPMLVLCVSTSVISATYVNNLLCQAFGISPALLEVGEIASFELSHVGYLALLGLMMALAVGIFNTAVFYFDKLCDKLKKKIPGYVFLIVVFLLTGLAAFFLPDGVHSGHDIIIDVIFEEKTLGYLAILLLFRAFMMLPVSESGATGGTFIPTLAIGALAGAVSSKILISIGMPEHLFSVALLLGMCAFIGGTLRAPLTATVLFIELTASFTNLFFVAIVIFIVNFATELLNQQPFFEVVLEDMEEAQNRGNTAKIVRFEVKVSEGAFVVGKSVRDVMWPSSSIVETITRDGNDQKSMDNDGEKKVYPKDTLIIRARLYDIDEVKNQLYTLVGKDFEITVKEIVE